jgi:hypothetical protein
MSAVVADVFRIAGSPREKADTVSGKKADERMTDLPPVGVVLEKTVPAVAGEFDQAIPLDDLLDAMTEYSAQVADFLLELRARCEPIG